jgi:hypothetical protein
MLISLKIQVLRILIGFSSQNSFWGTRFCNPAMGGDRGGLVGLHLVLVCLRKKSTEAEAKACFEDGDLKGY